MQLLLGRLHVFEGLLLLLLFELELQRDDEDNDDEELEEEDDVGPAQLVTRCTVYKVAQGVEVMVGQIADVVIVTWA